jgi:hypothetical protein
MNDRNQHSQRIGKDLSKSAIAGVLCVTAILYFAIQWKYASRIAPNRIFSASRMTDQVGMAIEETEVAARARLVLDANILLRGILGNQSSLSA